MSRRSRKRGKAGEQGWLGKATLGLIVVGVLGAGIMYAMVRGYLHSDGFRGFLSEKVSALAGVDGEFTPFQWDGLAVETSAFDATGDGMVRRVRLDGLHTEDGVGGLRRGVWEIQGSRMQRLEVSLDVRTLDAAGSAQEVRQVVPPRAKEPSWLPRQVEVKGLDVRDVVAKVHINQGWISIDGMKARIEPAGMRHAYGIEVAEGTLRMPFTWIPDIRMGRAKLRYQDGQIFLNSGSAAVWHGGHVDVSGEWDHATRRYSLGGDVSGVKCEDLFNEDWSKRFQGNMNSDFSVNNHAGLPVARGRLTVSDGILTALPVLDSLAAYADTRRFRVLTLSEAHADWRWNKDELRFSNLVLASEGLIRLEGNISIRGGEIDGNFRIGLAPGTLASIPGAETDVFVAGERGLIWAPLRITGTLENPKEDLTDRLRAAAGLRMFDIVPETGEKVMKYTRSIFGDSPSKTVDQGVKIIEKGSKAVREVSDILNGILGEEKPPEREKDRAKEDP